MGKVTWPLIIFPFTFHLESYTCTYLIFSLHQNINLPNMISFLKHPYCGLNKENSYPVKLSSLTDQQKQPQTRSFVDNIFPFWYSVLFLVPSHTPMSLTSNPQGVLKFSGLLKHRNTACSDHRVLQRSGSSKALEYTWGNGDQKFKRLAQGHTGGNTITSTILFSFLFFYMQK